MTDYKSLLGVVTIAIGLVSYSLYLKNVFAGRTKPDPFSWLIWGTLATITFFAQTAEQGGAGAWATGLTAIACLLIALIAYARGTGRVKTIDVISLCGAIVAIIAWRLTNDPLWAVVLAIGVGAIGFVPTFQKAFYKPGEETTATYALNALKFAIALIALQSFTPTTWLYPAALTLMNTSLATTLFLRRIV